MTTDISFPYPAGFLRKLLRLPILGYRMGLGGLLDAMQIMVLTTRGRSSGLPRHTAIEYRQHGSKIYLVSVWGDRPHWYRNLLKCPEVTIQQGGRVRAATAEQVTNSGEALRVLHLFRRRAPSIYDSIIARISARESIDSRSLHEVTDNFTIVRIVPRAGEVKLPPVPVDARWVIPVAAVGISTALLLALLQLRAPRSKKHAG
ncbi:MAG: nitroreductase family deazaflavin-dependent oxidoreductase [Chloroflexi bacterium]|nr:nitroreductase family deazaflavin-dependent oxidoreductase [Chloroflexota bacterium]